MARDSDEKLQKAGHQLLKIREMREILQFDPTTDPNGEFALNPSKAVPGFEKEHYHASDLRKEIEPWLTALF